jgi:hypothetical protein
MAQRPGYLSKTPMTGGVHGTGWAVDHHDLVRGETGTVDMARRALAVSPLGSSPEG